MLWLILTQAIVAFTTVERGQGSQLDAPREVVIRTADEWRRLCQEHAPARPLPDIDFETTIVAGVFLGTRQTASFEVEIAAVHSEDDRAHHRVRGTAAAQIITSPFHLISMARHAGGAVFESVERAAAVRPLVSDSSRLPAAPPRGDRAELAYAPRNPEIAPSVPN